MAKKDVLVILKDAKSNSILLHGAFVLPPKFVGMSSHEPPWIKLNTSSNPIRVDCWDTPSFCSLRGPKHIVNSSFHLIFL
jgi:hypothetical protein